MSRNARQRKPSNSIRLQRTAKDLEADKLKETGEKLFRKKDFKHAAEIFEQAIALDHNDINAWNGLGNCLFSQNDHKAALLAFEQVRVLDPKNAVAWYKVGVTKLELKDNAGAMEALKYAIYLSPADSDAWFKLSYARYEMNDIKGAIEACNQSLILTPLDPNVSYTLARYLTLDNQPIEAMQKLTRAIALNAELATRAQAEPDFDRIRKLPKFRQLVGIITTPVEGAPTISSTSFREHNELSREPNQTVSKPREKNKLNASSTSPDREGDYLNKAQSTTKLIDKNTVTTPKSKPDQEIVPKSSSSSEKKMLSLSRQYEYIAGKVRVKVKVVNEGAEGLLRVNFTLDIPQSFRLLRVEPEDYFHVSSLVKLNDLLPGEEKAIAYMLEPLICGKESLGGTVSAVDPKGRPYALPMNPLEIIVRCPLFARPEEINLPTVQRMLGDLPVKSERVFYLPDTLSPPDALEITKSAVGERDVRLVGSFTGTSESGFFEESVWFYGMTKVGQKRYILTTSVSEKDRTIRLSTACDDEAGCTGFLAEAGATIRRELVRRGAVDSEEGVVELTCEKCGATLPRAPIIGRNVSCPDCGWTWKVGDFFR